MESLGKRLSDAVEKWAEGVESQGKEGAAKTFQRAIAARLSEKDAGGKAGASYRSLLSYMSGGSEPSLEWLREAADILDVPVPMLLFGIDTSTPPMADAIGPMTLYAGGVGADVLAALVHKLALAQPEQVATEADLDGLGERIGSAVTSLAMAIRRSAPIDQSTAVAISVLSALLAYAPGPGEGRPISEIISKLPTGSRRA